jgi:hypothetical protein
MPEKWQQNRFRQEKGWGRNMRRRIWDLGFKTWGFWDFEFETPDLNKSERD